MTSPVVTVRPDAHLKEVASTLLRIGISAAPVVDVDGRLVGIVSEQDLLALETNPDPTAQERPARFHDVPGRVAADVMTADVVAVDPDADVSRVARLMLRHRIKTVPVVADGRVVGIVSRRDILKILARTDHEIALELEDLLEEEVDVIGRYRASVEDGVVTLTGPKDRSSRRLAELLARSLPGVVGVEFREADVA
jgi:CBS domain-containing protein